MAQIGLMFEGQWGLTWGRWQKLLQAADALGYQCVFRSDHYTIGPPDEESLETWISLTYAATNSQRIEFGPLVSPVTFRQPALLARMAAQVDDLSGGRLVLGMGMGWHEREHRQFGIPFYDQSTRIAMFREALELTKLLLESDEPVSMSGDHFSLDGAILLPRPQRKTPILIGGNGMKVTLPLTAKYADEWNGVHISPDGYRERVARLNELLDEEGRDRTSVKRSLMTQCVFGKDDADLQARATKIGALDALQDESKIVGTPSQMVDKIGQYVDAGVERFMLMWRDQDDLDGIEAMANAVLPHFHK